MLVRFTIALVLLLPQRAAPPQWSQDVLDLFFSDAREHLVGERPQGKLSAASSSQHAGDKSVGEATGAQPSRWSQIIMAETLIAETKRLNNILASSVGSPSQFKSGSYRDCRRVFAELAVLFAVMAEYGDNEQLRWQTTASSLRNSFSRASRNCKVATDQSFAEAQKRHEDLNELLRGQFVSDADPPEDIAWDQLAERSLLMKRMQLTLKNHLSSSLGSAGSFRRKSRDLRHEAQVLALLAEVIQQPEYEFSDDETFLEYAQRLRKASLQLDRACEQNDYESARQAVGKATQSCSECHDGYRG